MIRKVYAIIILLLPGLHAGADHLFGGDISYICLGNNQYRVSVNFYRDCISILPPDSIALNVSNVCGASPSVYMLHPGGQIQLSTNCPNNTCTGNGASPGVDRTEFTDTITLTDTCSYWILAADLGSRTTYVNIFDQTSINDLYLEATINNTVACADAPGFTDPIWIACTSDTNCLVHGNPVPGDSTVWSLIAPRKGPNQFVPYLPGYSVTHPFDPSDTLSIDPVTGEFCFNATQAVWSNYTVQATNYRNGIMTGQSMRDMSIVLIDCSALPEISGINNGSSTDTVALINDQMCFDIYSSPTLSWDSTTIYWDFGINGTFTKFPSQYEYATFCWTPQIADTGLQCFEVSCYENSCPGQRVSYKTFCVYVLDSTDYAIWLGEHDEEFRPIKIYPQPFTDNLKVEFNKLYKECFVKIFNESAQVVFDNKFSGIQFFELNTEFLPEGFYTIQIINSDHLNNFRIIKIQN